MKPPRLVCAALVAAAALAGCADDPVPASPPTVSANPSVRPTAVPLGAEGLDVRYLGDDGRVKTLRVEDFPR